MAIAKLGHSYGRLPLRFEENRGQVERQVKFLSRGSGHSLFLLPREAVLLSREPAPKPLPKGEREAEVTPGKGVADGAGAQRCARSDRS